MDIYICPMCKQENGDHQKYCLNCGTWLLNPTFPAVKKEKVKPKSIKRGFGSVIVILAILGVVWFYKGSNLPGNKIVFEKIDLGTQYTLSQLEISKSAKSSVVADLTIHEATSAPLEISAVFYDSAETRVGRASTLISNQLSAGQTTTLIMKLDEPVSLANARSVRVEVTPLSPLQLIERAADIVK